MVEVDCGSCREKCCLYRGWKVFFLSEERNRVAELYGEAIAQKIDLFQQRTNGGPVFAVTLPCPFFSAEVGRCGIYEARPLICRIFPVEMEPITGSVYMDQKVCPQRAEAKVQIGLVQVEVEKWCARFWNTSLPEQMSDSVPICDERP